MTEMRKADHIKICLVEDTQARSVTTGLEDIHLLHRALPEIAREDIDLSSCLFGHKVAAPIVIEGMTGGTQEAANINAVLAEAAERFELAMGVGSQRAALESPELAYTYRIARERGPNVFLMANLGLAQVLKDDWETKVRWAVEMIDADALCVHVNALQEAVQKEGETDFEGALERLKELTSAASVPVIIKETGAGIASEEAQLLEVTRIAGIDVGGAGGTSWSAVESHRQLGSSQTGSLAHTFWDWGIPTAASTIEVAKTTRLVVISSGGIRSGIDIAKTLGLGANAAGVALPFLKAAVKGHLTEVLQGMIDELRTALFLSGASGVEDLKQFPIVITGRTAEWLRVRGFKPEEYARRGWGK